MSTRANPSALTVLRNNLAALQSLAIQAGELTIARSIGALVDSLNQRLANAREAA